MDRTEGQTSGQGSIYRRTEDRGQKDRRYKDIKTVGLRKASEHEYICQLSAVGYLEHVFYSPGMDTLLWKTPPWHIVSDCVFDQSKTETVWALTWWPFVILNFPSKPEGSIGPSSKCSRERKWRSTGDDGKSRTHWRFVHGRRTFRHNLGQLCPASTRAFRCFGSGDRFGRNTTGHRPWWVPGVQWAN